jgi:HK97 gp10 family phage protein
MAGPVVTVKFEGGRELDAALQSLSDDMDISKATIRNVMRRGLVQAGQQTADLAMQLAPDDPATPSPDLHTSIASGTRLTARQTKLNKKSEDKPFAEAFVGPTKDVNSYASLVEFGTANTGPRPFMRPAWESTKDAVMKSITGFVQGQIAKAVERAQRKALKVAAK